MELCPLRGYILRSVYEGATYAEIAEAITTSLNVDGHAVEYSDMYRLAEAVVTSYYADVPYRLP